MFIRNDFMVPKAGSADHTRHRVFSYTWYLVETDGTISGYAQMEWSRLKASEDGTYIAPVRQ